MLAQGVIWLGQTDAPTVAMLREAMEDYERLRATPGVPPREVRETRKEVTGLLSQLGFDPTARARLGLAEVKAKSKHEELEERRQKRGSK